MIAAELGADVMIAKTGGLLHDLGKAGTPPAEWPSHRGHEQRSVALIESLCERVRVPGEYRELAVIVARLHGNVHRAFELRRRGARLRRRAPSRRRYGR